VLRLIAVALALVSAEARAFDAVIVPSGPFAADGERVYPVELYLTDGERLVHPAKVELRCLRGQAVEAGTTRDGGFRFRYRPVKVESPESDRCTVESGGKKAPAAIALEPAGRARITLELPPEPLVLAPHGRETAKVKVHVRDAAGRPIPLPLRLAASVGTISAATATGPGEYEALYTAPEARFPQVAILAAGSASDGAYGIAPLKISARVTVEGQAEPGGTMRVIVEGRTFGPQAIGADGRFALPVIVPPGGRALGLSVDKLGNEKRRDLDLALPPFPRTLLAVLPGELRADGEARAEVVVAAIDGRGELSRGAPPKLSTDGGTLAQAVARGPGLFTATLTAPRGIGEGALHVSAQGARATVTLRAGPPARVTIADPGEPLACGLDLPQAVIATVADAQGAKIAGAQLAATLAGGKVGEIVDRGDGSYRIEVIPPVDPGKGRAALRVEVAAAPPGPPARVSLHLAPGSNAAAATAEAWVDDDLGRAVPGIEVAIAVDAGDGKSDSSTGTTDRYGAWQQRFAMRGKRAHLVATAPALGAARAILDVIDAGGALHAGLEEGSLPPAAPSVEREIALKPALPVDLRIAADPPAVKPGGISRVRIQLAGAGGPSLPTGKLLPQASAGKLEPLPTIAGAVEYRFVAPAGAAPGTRCVVSVTDPKSGITVFTEVVVK
jgi:hypothetical protein